MSPIRSTRTPRSWTIPPAVRDVGPRMVGANVVIAGQIADPGFKDVFRLADCGFPIAEVVADGSVMITKLDDTGGCVTTVTVKQQLLYEYRIRALT